MNKILFFLCFVMVVTMVLSGCATTSDYQVLVFDSSDSGSNAAIACEFSYWNEMEVDNSNTKPLLTVEVNGERHTGTYERATTIVPNTYPVYVYSSGNGEYFHLNPDGQLTLYHWGQSESDEPQRMKLSESACLDVAMQFLNDYVDVAQYEVETEYNQEQGRYVFAFTKYIQNHKTADAAKITVLETGELYSFSSTMLGKIPVDVQFEFDSQKTTDAISNKLNSLYAGEKEDYDYMNWEISEQFLTVLENGEVVLVCYVDVSFITKVGDNYANVGEKIAMIVRR